MVLGFVVTALFIITCLRAIDKKNRKQGILTKIHFSVSILLVVVTIAHIVITIPVWKMRTLTVLLTGFGALAFILIAPVSAMKKKIKLHRISAMLAALLIVSHIAFNLMGFSAYRGQVDNTTINDVDISNIPDGVYAGDYDVGFIYAKVEVTVKDHEIADIAILEHRNERGKPAERIIDVIIEQQRITVDAVTSATNSSTVIKKAVENALQSAVD
jgi:uncharacterized protein with FMN-binding domain